MSKQSKSQWDFGELFPAEATRRVLSVSELTAQVKRLLEKQVGSVWVTGEITNFRAQSSGHIYFTLKDAGSQLSCVLFSRESVTHRDLLADGQKVLLHGDVTVYEARGQYQLIVRAVELQGVGALQVQFEKLKAKLAAEGLFDAGRKRPLPRYPQRIGLVTSPTGAAIRDVLHVIQRRNPSLEIVLVPCRVQGEGAADEIAEAVRSLNELNIQHSTFNIQLILVTRGGGSLEDLWAFNEEAVARAIHESALPVVSAVGHEIDFTISDFVADIRAATPSVAAEIVTEDVFAVREFVADLPSLMSLRVRRHIRHCAEDLEQASHRLALAHPRRRVDELLQRLDDLRASLSRCVKQSARERRATWNSLASRLTQVRPIRRLKEQTHLVLHLQQGVVKALESKLMQKRLFLENLESRLQLLGPEQVLARGYSITMDSATGTVLRNSGEVKAGQRLRTRLKQGEVYSKTEKPS